MDLEEFEQNTGWRGVFNCLPANKNTAQKVVLPLGYFYSPFLTQPQVIKASPLFCAKCKAAICSFSNKNKNTRTWTCHFCLTSNSLPVDIGFQQVEQYIESRVGQNGLLFIVDLCISEKQLASVKETMVKTIQKLPQNIFVGLVAFNRNVFLYDFSQENTKFICLSGLEDYSANNYLKLKQCLNLAGTLDPKFPQKIIMSKYYVPIQNNIEKLIKAVQALEHDRHFVPRDQREKRATGCALQISIGLLAEITVNTRFVALIGGPCTVGVGKVVNLPLKNTIRSYVDIFEGNQNSQHIKAATSHYQKLEDLIIKNKHTMDIWSYGLDQFGLLEMKSMVNNSGGTLAMHQEFDHFIFQTSFEKFYEPNQDFFNFPIACQLQIRVSKQLKINGIIGTCKSKKQNTLKCAADMQIGEGGTSSWYLGGISFNNALCLIISLIDSNDNKEKQGYIQAITKYKYSDNVQRTRVSTLCLDYLRENQMIEFGKRFDEQAATVMLARYASKKAEVEDTIEVKKWVDRLLLKFCVRFAFYNRHDRGSFKLPHPIKHFPQFIYHLRRSAFINPFGAPPDQSIYIKTCMTRQSIANCMVMIQPALLKYTPDSKQPIPVELDVQELKEDVILLLDSYFNVLVWYGENVWSWKEDNLQEDPEYEYLKDFFSIPLQDASEIMYDRIPSSNFYETFKNDGKERYLKSRVNPSKGKTAENDGHFVSDDAPITLFMQFLVKSVINYNE